MLDPVMHGNAYSNEEYLPINFKPGCDWSVKESHYYTADKTDVVFHNGEYIHTNPYETPVYINLYNKTTGEEMNCMLTIRKFDTQIITYGNPKVGTRLTITYQDEKTTSICQAYFKDNPTDKVKKTVITGPEFECLGKKHTVHFNSIETLVRQLNKAFFDGSCYINGNCIVIRLPRVEGGQYLVRVSNGHGMALIEGEQTYVG